MRINPKKVMREYCLTEDGGKCRYYRNTTDCGPCECDRHKRHLSGQVERDGAVRRPIWCNGGTHLRVKVSPVVVGDKEFCMFESQQICTFLRHNKGGYYWRCPALDISFDACCGDYERPDRCRELEVE